MAYAATYPSQALSHSYSSRGYQTPRTPGPGYNDYGHYPYGDPVYDDADYNGYGDSHYSNGYSSYATPRTSSYYGSGAYDDMALNRRSSYYGTDLDYNVPYTGTPYTAGALTPSRSRRSSSVSFQLPSTSGQQLSTSHNSSYGYDHRGRGVPRIKFRSKYSTSGMSLSEAVGGERPVGGDSYKWHDLHADRNGEIFLRVAWNGYRTITYRVPVDWYDGRVRLSSLVRRVARACIHYLQSNSINTSWDMIKIYSIEEVMYGTWQPQLTVRQY
ncbi:uncharacterized protein FOMMEDRAFT_147835 [Fomitiporia mediterranea MF3/22]|uniref:uncharacterized protein n=1 Tax=Fomitiporia mediterranea (strain MF3/22) TaxID=694068 RepID=UPI0004408D44|nr:uncharacterized protein FOMMEDRAFT_147835 [Fomitiporia mediterranea MF3/22]EJD01259.1 hypothetical protein FOMMEDRAFT_147835 [Fomitiporia mediterranea MF3/22]